MTSTPFSWDNDSAPTGCVLVNKDGDSSDSSITLTGNQELNKTASPSSAIKKKKDKLIEIVSQDKIRSVAFLPNGKQIVGAGDGGKVHWWETKDSGNEVGTSMGEWTRDAIWSIAISQDGKWIVAGTSSGKVMVWNAETRENTLTLKGHKNTVTTVDISSDATGIASGSRDRNVRDWTLPAGNRRSNPLGHNDTVTMVRFSPNNHLLATATGSNTSIRIYERNAFGGLYLLVEFPIRFGHLGFNESLSWTGDSKHLFALSRDGKIHCLDVHTGTTLSQWLTHSTHAHGCTQVALARNGGFVAVSDESSVSFWDTTTHNQVGPTVHCPARVEYMAISANYDLVTAGDKKITLRNLCDILPSPYSDEIYEIQNPDKEITIFNKTVKELHIQLAKSRSAAKELEDRLKETIELLPTDLHVQNIKSASLQKSIKELVEFDRKANVLVQQLHIEISNAEQKAESLPKITHTYRRKDDCEMFYAEGYVVDAAKPLLEIAQTEMQDGLTDWLPVFTNKCVTTLEGIGDEAAKIEEHDDTLTAYATALSLSPLLSSDLSMKCARTMLLRGSEDDALDVATKFKLPRTIIFCAICEVLEGDGRITEAISYFQRMQRKVTVGGSTPDELTHWDLEFRRRCTERLESLADAAMNSQNYKEASGYFSTILSLSPVGRMDTLIKRSRAQAMMGLWKDALKDVEEVIQINESSHLGDGQKHPEVIEAFESMLSKLK